MVEKVFQKDLTNFSQGAYIRGSEWATLRFRNIIIDGKTKITVVHGDSTDITEWQNRVGATEMTETEAQTYVDNFCAGKTDPDTGEPISIDVSSYLQTGAI